MEKEENNTDTEQQGSSFFGIATILVFGLITITDILFLFFKQ